MKGEALKGHLDLILLLALEKKPGYAYQIIEELRTWTQGRLHLAEGTIYPALHRLEDAGLLESRTEVAGGRRRRIYALTARGREECSRMAVEWEEFSESVELLLQEAPRRSA